MIKLNHMTLIVSWIARDVKEDGLRPSAAYIACDSRISWGGNHFDFGRKIFGCNKYPDIFGYCGDVLFPLMVISQIKDAIDSDALYGQNYSNEDKFEAVYQKLSEFLDEYPRNNDIISDSFSILHVTRDRACNFDRCLYKWSREDGRLKKEEIPLENRYDTIFFRGEGSDEYEINLNEFEKGGESGTSRSAFQCFCYTLSRIGVNSCGGAPQLIGMYRNTNSKIFGIIYNNRKFVNGIPLPDNHTNSNIEWRNELFEICDCDTMMIKEDAQRQPIVFMK